MKVTKSSSVRGPWAKGSELSGVKSAVITTEAEDVPSNYSNKDGSPKTQLVCRVKFEGIDEEKNFNINIPTKDALIDAFGDDTAMWMNKPLAVETEKVRVAGKAGVSVYLIPDGFEKVDDADGYVHVLRIDRDSDQTNVPNEDGDQDPDQKALDEVPY